MTTDAVSAFASQAAVARQMGSEFVARVMEAFARNLDRALSRRDAS